LPGEGRSADPGLIVPEVAPEVRPLVRLGLVRAEGVAVGPAGPALIEEMDRLAAELAAAHAGGPPSAIPRLAPARALNRAFGVDPTRTRPSSEALLRRILQGRPLPRILNVVDVGTLCALRLLLTLGLYDVARIRGRAALRRGRPGESFEGIRKDRVNLEGRIVLADAEGPFGNPTSDSLRTSVTEATRSVWMVIFAPASHPAGPLESGVVFARAAIERHLGRPGEPPSTWGAVHP
jgi:DNA/RNA-binding domain of Phe-tRNA-synthetase-like protein